MRVIAGEARSLPLKTVKNDKVRPTTDRIKETIFNILNPYLYGARFLDVFAGSGGIGIEALSRGAKECVFIDNSQESIDVINQNLEFTRLKDRAKVIKGDAGDTIVVMNPEEPFDIIYMDPVYGRGGWKQPLTNISRANIATGDTLIVVEDDLMDPLEVGDVFSGFEVVRIKQYRKNRHIFLKKYKNHEEK